MWQIASRIKLCRRGWKTEKASARSGSTQGLSLRSVKVRMSTLSSSEIITAASFPLAQQFGAEKIVMTGGNSFGPSQVWNLYPVYFYQWPRITALSLSFFNNFFSGVFPKQTDILRSVLSVKFVLRADLPRAGSAHNKSAKRESSGGSILRSI